MEFVKEETVETPARADGYTCARSKDRYRMLSWLTARRVSVGV